MNVIVNNIEWDLDGQSVTLPTNSILIIDLPDMQSRCGELDDIIGDMLSNKYGFCHLGFGYTDTIWSHPDAIESVKHVLRHKG